MELTHIYEIWRHADGSVLILVLLWVLVELKQLRRRVERIEGILLERTFSSLYTETKSSLRGGNNEKDRRNN